MSCSTRISLASRRCSTPTSPRTAAISNPRVFGQRLSLTPTSEQLQQRLLTGTTTLREIRYRTFPHSGASRPLQTRNVLLRRFGSAGSLSVIITQRQFQSRCHEQVDSCHESRVKRFPAATYLGSYQRWRTLH